MKWSEEQPPNNTTSYHHIICETPLGLCIIDWKGWKEDPSYDAWVGDLWLGSARSLEEAKKICHDYLHEIRRKLIHFLDKFENIHP